MRLIIAILLLAASATELRANFFEAMPGQYVSEMRAPDGWSVFGVVNVSRGSCIAVRGDNVSPPTGMMIGGAHHGLLGKGIVVLRVKEAFISNLETEYGDAISEYEFLKKQRKDGAIYQWAVRPIQAWPSGGYRFRYDGEKFFQKQVGNEPLLASLVADPRRKVDFDATSYRYPTINRGISIDSVKDNLPNLELLENYLLACEDGVRAEFPNSSVKGVGF